MLPELLFLLNRRVSRGLALEDHQLNELALWASQGEVVVVREIQKKYEEVLQKKVTKSAIYKLLHRHHWRKVFPRPHHPNQNKDEM